MGHVRMGALLIGDMLMGDGRGSFLVSRPRHLDHGQGFGFPQRAVYLEDKARAQGYPDLASPLGLRNPTGVAHKMPSGLSDSMRNAH